MTLSDLTHYAETGLASAAILVPLVGTLGHLLAALPWTFTKTIGNALNAVSLDVGDFLNAAKNAKAAVAEAKAKKDSQ